MAPGWSLHRGLVVAGFGAVVAAILLFANGNVATILSPDMLPFAPAIVLVALVARRESGKLLLAASIAIAVLPLMVLLLFGGLEELANPLGGNEYLSVLCLVLALALALPAGVQAYRNRGLARAGLRGAWRTPHGIAALAVTALVMGAMAAGALASGRAAQTASGGAGYDLAPEGHAGVAAANFAFAPGSVAVAAGKLTELTVANKDSMLHTFTYTVGGVTYSHDLLPGSTTTFLVKIDAPGRVPFWCKPHSSAAADGSRSGMTGALQVA
jgi:plastocyanin